MTKDALDERRKLLEEEYFVKANAESLKRLNDQNRKRPLKSPVTGEDMVTAALMGVVIHKCEKSGGIWLEKGELEEIIKHVKESEDENWFSKFIHKLF
jgi:hypothetical protein